MSMVPPRSEAKGAPRCSFPLFFISQHSRVLGEKCPSLQSGFWVNILGVGVKINNIQYLPSGILPLCHVSYYPLLSGYMQLQHNMQQKQWQKGRLPIKRCKKTVQPRLHMWGEIGEGDYKAMQKWKSY